LLSDVSDWEGDFGAADISLIDIDDSSLCCPFFSSSSELTDFKVFLSNITGLVALLGELFAFNVLLLKWFSRLGLIGSSLSPIEKDKIIITYVQSRLYSL